MGAALNTCQVGGVDEELIFDRKTAFRSVGCQAPTDSLLKALNANASSSSSQAGGGCALTLDSRTSNEDGSQARSTPLALLDGHASTASLAEEEKETIGADSVWQSVEAAPREEVASPSSEDLAALEARLEARLQELKAVPGEEENRSVAASRVLHPSIPEEQLLLGPAAEEETAAGQPACWTPTLDPTKAVPVDSGASLVMPPQLRQKQTTDEGVFQQQPAPPPRVAPAQQHRQLVLPALPAVQQAPPPQGPPMSASDAKFKIKEWQMQLRLEARQIDRDIRRVKTEEARMQKTMRTEADKGNTNGVQQLARSVVRSRRSVLQLEKAKVQLHDMDLQLTSCSATLSVKNAMRLSVDAMQNGGGIQELGAIVEQFQQENARRSGVDELVDEALRSDEDEEAVAAEAQRVLEELELDKLRLLTSTAAPRQTLATSSVPGSGSAAPTASAAGGGRQPLTTARHGGS
mmetsp:Transcript_118998/g.237227  ORF Transcript_118998/g.237227 Transcript_118998/m.237227 type:complete len:464 (+) Transcript_118998:69-1460(+)